MSKQVGLREAVSIGIGGMVGGGIFAVLGLAVSMAKGGTPLAFLYAGILALITCYSYSRLSIAYPDTGGTVRFINEGFGITIFSGGINNLLWVSYIIMLSLYASAFGSYAPNLWKITGSGLDYHIFASFIIVLATAVNYYSVKVVGRIESWSVIIKLIILLAFIGVGCAGLAGNDNLVQLRPSGWADPLNLVTGGMVIFIAYEGFELIANSVPDMKQPERNVKRAYFISVGFVIVLYMAIAVVTIGSLPFSKIAASEEYVLAEAAKPMLGRTGFTIITIAALFSTFSAINATLYGGSRVSYEIAKDDELPKHLASMVWNHPVGLMITAVATLVLVNLLKLESISTAGSVGFLLIFSTVNYVGFRKADAIHGSRAVSLAGCVLCLAATAALISQQITNNRIGVITAGSIIACCFAVEWIYMRLDRTGD